MQRPELPGLVLHILFFGHLCDLVLLNDLVVLGGSIVSKWTTTIELHGSLSLHQKRVHLNRRNNMIKSEKYEEYMSEATACLRQKQKHTSKEL